MDAKEWENLFYPQKNLKAHLFSVFLGTFFLGEK
jgi:hypothetical protein